MWSLRLVMSECSLSGRGQGHVSNFYIVDLDNFATGIQVISTSRPWSVCLWHIWDDESDSVLSWLSVHVHYTLPPTKLNDVNSTQTQNSNFIPSIWSGLVVQVVSALAWYTHTHPFNGVFSRTTQVTRYQKGHTNLDFTEARDGVWQWHQLGHMQVCT